MKRSTKIVCLAATLLFSIQLVFGQQEQPVHAARASRAHEVGWQTASTLPSLPTGDQPDTALSLAGRAGAPASLPGARQPSGSGDLTELPDMTAAGLGRLQRPETRRKELYAILKAKESQTGYRKDTSYIDLLDAIAHDYYGISADSAFHYSRAALALSEESGYGRGQSVSWRMIGNTYEMIGDYRNMLSSYHRSLSIASAIRDPNLEAKAHLNIALFYKDVGAYTDALAQMEEVSRIYQRNLDSSQLARIYSDQADICYRQGDYARAEEHARLALEIVSRLRDEQEIASDDNLLGKVLAARGDYRGSLEHLRHSLVYSMGRDDKLNMTESTALLAQTYLLQKDYPRALRFGKESLLLARLVRRNKEINIAGKVLADIYEARGDQKHALFYYKIYKAYSDSLFNDATRRQAFAMESKFEYERKEAQLREEAARKDLLQKEADRNHALQIYGAAVLILFLSVIAIVLFRSRAEKHRTNLLLEAKNQEISRQKEEMEHQAVQLLLNNQEKDKLFSIIAHDLRGPLNSLKGLLDFLKEKSLSDAEIRSMMAELRRTVDYSAELVSNLLFWASSQMDGIVVSPVKIGLAQVTTEVMNLFSKQASDKQIILQNEIDPACMGYADKDMIQVILRNLVSNAIKFCRAGDLITASARVVESEVEICIADTGIGIPEAVLEKINRRESVTTYGTSREKGTGLGMLLCREFAEVNKGRFRIESQTGKGSRCYFTVPLPASSSSISV